MSSSPYRKMEIKEEKKMKLQKWSTLMVLTILLWVIATSAAALLGGAISYVASGKVMISAVGVPAGIMGFISFIPFGIAVGSWLVQRLEKLGAGL